MLLPYEYEWSRISWNYNVINRKNDFGETSRKKINFINKLKYAEHKLFCICIDVYKIYEGGDFDKTYEALSKFKNEKVKINNMLIEKCKNMNHYPEFEQSY